MLGVEGLPVHIIVGATIITIPLIVINRTFVVNGAVLCAVLVGVGYVATCLVVTLGVGVGAVLVVVSASATPKTILECRALEVLVVRVKLLAFVAVDGVREWVAVGMVARGGLVV